MNRARNLDHKERTCERFVYSIVEMMRFYDSLSNMADTFVLGIHEVRKGLWALFVDCASRMLIGWADKFLSRG